MGREAVEVIVVVPPTTSEIIDVIASRISERVSPMSLSGSSSLVWPGFAREESRLWEVCRRMENHYRDLDLVQVLVQALVRDQSWVQLELRLCRDQRNPRL